MHLEGMVTLNKPSDGERTCRRSGESVMVGIPSEAVATREQSGGSVLSMTLAS